MALRDAVRGTIRHPMRAYYLPIAAAVLLGASAFMPWIAVETPRGGTPGIDHFPFITGCGCLHELAALKVLPAAGKAWLKDARLGKCSDPAQWQSRETFLPVSDKAVHIAGRQCEEQLVVLAIMQCLRD